MMMMMNALIDGRDGNRGLFVWSHHFGLLCHRLVMSGGKQLTELLRRHGLTSNKYRNAVLPAFLEAY